MAVQVHDPNLGVQVVQLTASMFASSTRGLLSCLSLIYIYIYTHLKTCIGTTEDHRDSPPEWN